MRIKSAKSYDLSYISEIANGDEAFVKMICQLFIETAPPIAVRISNAAKTKDWKLVSSLAHELKCAIDSFDIGESKLVIREIEADAKLGVNTSILPMMIEEIKYLVNSTSRQIKKDYGIV